MKPSKLLILLSIMLLLQACTSHIKPTPVTQGKPIATLFRGHVILGDQSQQFSPCQSRAQFRLELPARLFNTISGLEKHHYDELYAEVIGYLTIPSQTGYNGDYQAKLHIIRLNTVHALDSKDCQRATQPSTAVALDGSWKVTLSPSALQLITRHPTPSSASELFINKSLSASQRRYVTKSSELTLTSALCQTQQKSVIYGWRATLSDKHKTLTGCGKIGNYDTGQLWAGRYSAQSTHNGFTTALELYQDHTARTVYNYNNGSPTIIEQGFWQPINNSQVQVVMTTHQQQYLINERIFTRHGDHLRTSEEYIDKKRYPISQGGLTLFREVR